MERRQPEEGAEERNAAGAVPKELTISSSTDLNMPNLDGVGLIRAVRRDAVHRLTPVIMITTESQDAKKQEGKAAGATGWVVKPFTPEQLLAVVKKLIGVGGP